MSLDHPKFGLYQEVKVLQSRLGDPALVLNAFILSGTPFSDLLNIQGRFTAKDLEDRHVLFMDSANQYYLTGMFAKMQ
jgi:hypothetical protein